MTSILTPPPYNPNVSPPWTPPPYNPPGIHRHNAFVPIGETNYNEHEINTIVRRCLFGEDVEEDQKDVRLDHCLYNSECSICLESDVSSSNGGKIQCCKNTFHKNCIMKWVRTGKTSCPLCRRKIVH